MGRWKDLLTFEEYESGPVLPTPLPSRAFDGETYEPKRDHKRLRGQISKVFDLMKDGQWRTLGQIASVVEGTEAAVSARLRDFRKEKYGAHTVERWNIGNGIFKYRVVLNRSKEGE